MSVYRLALYQTGLQCTVVKNYCIFKDQTLIFVYFSGAQAMHIESDKSHSGHESDAWKAWLLVREISS